MIRLPFIIKVGAYTRRHVPRHAEHLRITQSSSGRACAEPTQVGNRRDRDLTSALHSDRAIPGGVRHAGLFFEDPDVRWLSGQPELSPPRYDAIIGRLVELGAWRKVLDVLIVHASIDQGLRAPWPDLRWVEAWIEERAPGLAKDIDR